MLRGLLFIVGIAIACARAEAACVDPATLVQSTVSITRHFDAREQEAEPGIVGVRGTGFFLSPTSLVTVEHVSAGMKLSERGWTQVELRVGEHTQSVPVRLQRV